MLLLKAVLFDLDGTLIDSEPWHKKAELQVFQALGLKLAMEDISMYVGATLPAMLRDLERRFDIEISQEEFVRAQQPVLGRFIAEEIQVFPDVMPFLRRIDGMRTAIVTSSVEWYVEAVRRRFADIRHLFETLVCEKDIVHGKPAPDPFLLGAQRLGLQACECLAVEDSVNGVKSAKAAGCTVVGIDREGRGHLSEADQVIRSFDELALPKPIEITEAR